ncbi:MAG: helix-turn-helix domain-containing protein [Rikenellaceae bacterium]|jgi:hypothetical protein|nr:helix-turn-helix domain-containing protein [Rikenellaceae bacterium]
MAQKLSFDKLPEAVAQVLEILTRGGSEYAALPELIQRVTLLEKKIDYLQRTVSPDKPVMEMKEVCRVLKLRPKAVNELALSGALPTREQGNKTVFYEEGVVKYYMKQGPWKEAVAKPAAEKPASEEGESAGFASSEAEGEGEQRIGIQAASEILDRSTAAIYQLIRNNSVPYHKEGRKIYFLRDELRAYSQTHRPRKRREK